MRGRAILYPGSQLISAAVALSIWLVISDRWTPAEQELPIRALAYGAPAGIVASLGLSYVVPNLFRRTPQGERAGRGPWSAVVAVAAVVPLTVLLGGWLVVLAGGTSRPALTWGASMCVAALVALGVLLAQLARTSDRLGLTVLGLAAAPVVAGAWLVGLALGDDLRNQCLVACAVMTAATVALAVPVAPYGSARTHREELPSTLRAALPLVPHLLLFGIFVQGVRISSTFEGGDAPLAAAHQLMLFVSVGLTFLASVSSFLGPRLQSTADDGYPEQLRSTVRIFTGAGVLAAVGMVVLLAAAEVAGYGPELAARGWWGVAVVVLAVSGYYSVSVQLMRHLRTWRIAAASCVGTGILLGVAVFADLSLDGAVVAYACSAVGLAVVAALGAVLDRAHRYQLGALWPLALGVAVGGVVLVV